MNVELAYARPSCRPQETAVLSAVRANTCVASSCLSYPAKICRFSIAAIPAVFSWSMVMDVLARRRSALVIGVLSIPAFVGILHVISKLRQAALIVFLSPRWRFLARLAIGGKICMNTRVRIPQAIFDAGFIVAYCMHLFRSGDGYSSTRALSTIGNRSPRSR